MAKQNEVDDNKGNDDDGTISDDEFGSKWDYFRSLKYLSEDEFDENEVKIKMQENILDETVSSLLSDEMDAMERTLKISKLKDDLNENIFDKIEDQKDKWLVMLLFKVCNDIDPTRMRFIQLSIILHQNGVLNSLDFLKIDNNPNKNNKIHNNHNQIGYHDNNHNMNVNDNQFDDAWNDDNWDDIDDHHVNDNPHSKNEVDDDMNDGITENNLQLIKLPTPNNELLTVRSMSMNQITTRYYRDFDEMKSIGHGAFGTVHLSKHKLDKKTYAIKKIIYKHSPTNHDDMKKEIIREVTCISALNHQNVVRYFGSWIEPFTTAHIVNDLNNNQYDDIDNNQLDDNGSLLNPNGDIPITRTDETENNDLQLILASDAANSLNAPTTNEIINYWTQKTDYYSVLFLQTEYCGNYNLKKLIEEESRVPDIEQIMDIFGQILLGIAHIHSHQILHRDLKPENIFLIKNSNNKSSKFTVKIGDFGLSKSITDSSVIIGNIEKQNESELEEKKGNENENENENEIDFANTPHSNGINLTSNTGTYIYAAPEQLSTDAYGTSVDIYSLGIILFEMIQKSFFGQERLFAIGKLKEKQEIDGDRIDKKKFDKVISFILDMTAKDPSLRPTSYSLLANEYIKAYWTKNMISNAISMPSNDNNIDPVHDNNISTEIE
eukprot:CAMPEP_0201571092 /NCGR_PEP_ID=MMETSP0190_2-20130828/13695_1 /ASSEMBLY_ACC=CAM_ASM_000263 /TAXON_ID=37353 /ORGANISM="Rosalina sp." /LENGTH=662 /DNA_ID=CAMNT_0047995371 /DNA_START=16 /DNA_END=2004 /DNA_ORIENTATION=-